MKTQKKDEVIVQKNKKRIIPVVISMLVVLVVVVALLILFTISSSGKGDKLQEQLELGEKYLNELDYEQAIVAYETAIEIDPKCVEAYLGLIDAYVAMEEYDKALEYVNIGYEETQDQRFEDCRTEIENSKENLSYRIEKDVAHLGLQVMKVGQDEITEYYSFTGGVIITISNDLYGAMNSEGEVIVPNEYNSCKQVANDEGHFILTKDDTYYVFDRDGNEVYNAPVYALESTGEWEYEVAHGIFVQDGYVVYQGQDGPDGNFKPKVYDLTRQMDLTVADYERTYEEPEETTYAGNSGVIGSGNGYIIRPLTPGEAWYTDIVDGYLVGYHMEFSVVGARKIHGDNVDIPIFNNMQEEGLCSGWPGGSVTSVNNGYSFFYINETYFDDMNSSGEYWISCGLVPVNSENGKACSLNVNQMAEEFQGIPKEQGYVPWGAQTYWTKGNNRVNLNQQMVLYIGEEANRKLYLLNFENAQVDEFGYVNPSDVVMGCYDSLTLNESGIYLGCNDNDWFYVNSKGEIVADFKDCTDFWNGYALIIDEDNQAYVINQEFEKVSAGYPADRVYRYGEALALEKDGEVILIMP